MFIVYMNKNILHTEDTRSILNLELWLSDHSTTSDRIYERIFVAEQSAF